MIIKEITEKGLIKRYSDKGVYIRQVETGAEYASAIDVSEDRYTYEETDREIEDLIDEIIMMETNKEIESWE